MESQFLEVRKKLGETETENRELREQIATSLKRGQPVDVALFSILLVVGEFWLIIVEKKAAGRKSLWIDEIASSEPRWVLESKE